MREFFDLLQLRTSESGRPAKANAVRALESGQLDIRTNQLSNQQNQHRFEAKERDISASTLTNQYCGSFNPCDSPPMPSDSSSSEYPNGFEALA